MCNLCGDEPCTCWRPAEKSFPYRETYRPLPFGITKEEFGLNLYEAIKLIGGIKGLEEQISLAINAHQGYKIQTLKARKQELQLQLAKALPTLTESEMAQILLRYPTVVSM